MSSPETAPLPVDPARQAEAMLRACEYQILQTVSAWLDLRVDDVLYVEGAEDFDKHTPTVAEAVQVKTSPQPISLGQKEIQQTLNHYWKLHRATPGREVRMRFLTCAPFTVERGNPFGAEVAGLDVWQRRPLSDNEARQLAEFLVKQPHLESNFRSWLERATPAQIRIELVECLTWQGHAEDAHFVERGIHNKLASFAEKRGAVPASVTKQVAQRLIEEVWKTLRNPAPRRLDFFRLEELWEEITRMSVPRSALDARWNDSSARPASPPSGAVELLRNGIPPLPGAVAQRSRLVVDWRLSLAAKGLLNLHGSTRTGKTTLAKLIALADAEKWKWWSAARMKSEEIQRALQNLVHEIARSPEVVDIVLDDLDFSPAVAQGMEESLGELLALVGGRRGRVLITSQKPLPARLQHAFGINLGQIVAVPRLDDEEVAELAAALGCTDETQRSIWAVLVRASTAGHPQLAAVRLWALRERGWPPVSVDTFTSGSDAIDTERADARQLLDGLPEPQRELLQRLSVFPVAFRRDHAIALGANPPPLASPGNVFNSLVGPWVEPLHAGYFALSPLLADGARAALAPNDFSTLQNETALVLLKTEPLTTMEGANAFLLYWQTRNSSMLSQLVNDWTEMDQPVFASLAGSLLWFSFVATQPDQRLFPDNPLLSLILRWFQLRVAMTAAPEHAAAIVEGWRWELANGTYPKPELHRMMFAGYVLPYHRVPLRAAVVVSLLGEVAQAAAAHPEMPIPPILSRGEMQELNYLPEFDDFVSILSFMSSPRCTNVEFLNEFLTALEGAGSDLRARILRGFVGGGIGAQIALDRVWLAESELEVPNWTRCLQVFERSVELGRAWGCPSLASAAMRGICVVLDEYVKDHRRAHETLDRMSAAGDLASHTVHDRRACIYFSEGNYAAAEEEWRLALADWPRRLAPYDTGAAFAARSAGVSAARQERWAAAADWFKEIIERLPTKGETEFMAGAYADAGYCLWKACRASDAISTLIEAWRLADMLPPERENFRAFITRKTVGHVIAWLHGKATRDGNVNLHEPFAGTCSSAEMPEGMKELPETESANVWLFLMRLERELGAGSRAAELGREALLEATNPATLSIASMETIAQNLSAGRVGTLPADVIALARAIQKAIALVPGHLANVATHVAPEAFDKSDSLRGASAFLAGLVAGHAHDHDWRQMLMDWRASLLADACSDWSDWFDTIERVLGGSAADAALLVRSPGRDWAGSMLAAWHLLLSEEASPENVFYAHARWLGEVGLSPWLRETAAAFCLQTEKAWWRVIRTPALLLQPRLSIPAIKEAFKIGDRGLARSARILLAASTAVNVRMAPEMKAAVRKMADENISL